MSQTAPSVKQQKYDPTVARVDMNLEERYGQGDANWPDWYAAYIAAERAGTELPT